MPTTVIGMTGIARTMAAQIPTAVPVAIEGRPTSTTRPRRLLKPRGQAGVSRNDGKDKSADERRHDDEYRQRKRDQKEAKTDDGAHGGYAGPPGQAQAEMP